MNVSRSGSAILARHISLSGSRGKSVRKTNKILALCAAAGIGAIGASSRAATIEKANVTSPPNLEDGGSWVGGIGGTSTGVPGAADIALWDNIITAGNGGSTQGADLSWLGIQVTNPASAITIANGGAAIGTTVTGNTFSGSLANGEVVTFTGTTLPTGVTAGLSYYVVGSTGTAFSVAAAAGGTAITLGGSPASVNFTQQFIDTLGASGINMAAATQNFTLGTAVNLGASQTWTVASGQTLTSTNVISLNPTAAAPVTLTIAGAGNTVLGQSSTTGSATSNTAILSGAGGALIKNGTGSLTLSGLSTFTGGTAVNNGTMVLNMGGMAGAGTGSTFTFPGNVTISGGTISTVTGARLSGSASNFPYVEVINQLNVAAGDDAFTQTHLSNTRVIDQLNNITRSVGGTLSFTDAITSPNSGNNGGGYRLANGTFDASPNVINGIYPYIAYTTSTTNTSWFAPGGTTTTSGKANSGAAYTAFTPTSTTAISGTTSTNVKVDSSPSISGTTNVSTLYFNDNAVRAISNTGTLIVTAGGVLVTNATAANADSITGGILEGGNPGSGSGNDLMLIDLASNAAASFTVSSTIADNTTNGNALGTATSLTKSGVGTVILSNTANNYTGGTFLNNGIIRIAGDGSLGAVPSPSAVANNLTFTGGTLQLGAANITINSNRGFTLADKGGTFDTNAFNSTYGGIIAGTGPFTKVGTGTLRLTSANTFSGGTTVSGGTLSAMNTSGSATGSGPVTVNSGGVLGGTGTVTGLVTLAQNASPGIGGHVAPGDAGVGLLNVNSITFNSGSAADIEFTNDTTYDQLNVLNSNGLTLNGGGLNLFATGGTAPYTPAIGNHIYNLFEYTGATPTGFDSTWTTASSTNPHILNQQPGFTYSFGTATVSGNTFITLDINVASAIVSAAWHTALNNQNWDLVTTSNWNPAAIPHAAGDTATFDTTSGIAGPTNVNVTAAQSVGNLFFNNSNPFTLVSSGGSLTMDTGVATSALIKVSLGNHTIGTPVTLNSNTVIDASAATDSLTVSGNIGGVGTLTIGSGGGGSGVGTVILTGTNNYAGNTTINSGTLQIGNATATGTLGGTNVSVATGGTLTFDRSSLYSFGGVISGAGKVNQIGGGTTLLSGANNYSGGTAINAGILKMGSASALGTGSTTITSPGLLDVNAQGPTLPGLVGTGTVDNTAAGATLITISNTAAAAFSGIIQNTGGAISLDKLGAGTQTLSGPNTYTGTTTIDAGTLSVGADNNLGAASGIMTINAGTLEANTTFSTARSILLNNTASTIQVDSVGSPAVAQVLTLTNGAGLTGPALTKTGTGTLVVNGPINLSGVTAVSAGVLTVPNSFTSSGGINLSGTGVLELQNASNTIGTGSLVIGGASGAASVNPGGTATLQVDSGATLTLPAFTIGAGAAGTSALDGLLYINGGTFTATGAVTLIGNSNSGGGGGIIIQPGSNATFTTINFNASADGGFVNILGGTVNIDTINEGRGSATSATVANLTKGVIVNGATANVSIGTLVLGTNNSYASLNLQAGSVNITTSFIDGNTSAASARGGVVQVTGGTLTSSVDMLMSANTGNGAANTEASVANFYGGSTTLPGIIMFPTHASGSMTGSSATVNIGNGNPVSLKIGADGIQVQTPGNTPLVVFNSGTLVATADWTTSSSAQINMQGTGTIQAADSSGNPHNLSFTGGITGITGPLLKTGGGTLTFGGNANFPSGIQVNGGTFLTLPSANISPFNVDVGGSAASSAATLAGTGILIPQNAPVDIHGPESGFAGHVAPGGPGATLGTLTFQSGLQMDGGSKADFTLAVGTGSTTSTVGFNSLVSVAGGLSLPDGSAGQKITVNLTDDANVSGQGSLGTGTYELFSYDSLSNNAFNPSEFTIGTVPSFLGAGTTYSFNQSLGSNQIDLTISAVITGPSNGSSFWTGLTDTNWATAHNWNLDTIPGVTSGSTNSDIATFNGAGNGNTAVVVDSGRNVKSITFDTASAGAYTIGSTGGNALTLSSGGTISVTSTVTNAQTINAPIVLAGGYTVTNNAPTATLTLGGAISSAASGTVTLGGNGTTILSGVNTYGGPTVIGSGTDTAKVTLTSAGKLASASVTVASGATANINGIFTAAPAVTVAGTATLGANDTINAATGSLLVRTWGALNVSGNLTVAPVAVASHTSRTVLVTNGLTDTGTINLNNNDLVIHNGSASTVFSELKAGFNAGVGYWNGTSASGSINSNTATASDGKSAATDSRFLTTLGYRNGSAAFTFEAGSSSPMSTAATDVLVKYTYYGDADLNGTLNGSDYQQIDAGFGSQTTGSPLSGWSNGDFNYDGKINGSDFALIDNAMNQLAANPTLTNPLALIAAPASLIAAPADLIAAPAATSAVPEPTTLGLLGLGAMGLLGRRKRRSM